MKLNEFYQKFNDMCRELNIDLDFSILEQRYIIEEENRPATAIELSHIQKNLSQIDYVSMCFKDNYILITVKPFQPNTNIKFNLESQS